MRFLLTILLISFSFGLKAQLEIKAEEYGLKGSIKSVLETEFQIIENYGRQSESRRALLNFNSDGYKTYEKQMDAGGAMLFAVNFKYGNENRLTEETNLDEKGNFSSKRTYKFENNILTVYSSDLAASIGKVTAKYHYSNLNVVKKEEFENDGSYRRIYIFRYDGNGNKVFEIQKNDNADKGTEVRYYYDEYDRVIKKEDYDDSGKKTYQSAYRYDSKGNIISETSSYVDSQDSITITYKYVYDKYDNWTEKSELMDDKLYSVILRRITY